MRASSSSTRTRSSRRADGAPGQTWTPAPKNRSSWGDRSSRISSGASNTRSSRFADGHSTRTRSPARTGCPASSTSRVATRRLAISGPRTRRASSIAAASRFGSARSRACRSGSCASACKTMPTLAAMVSSSPTVQLRTMLPISSLDGRPSTRSRRRRSVGSPSGWPPACRAAAPSSLLASPGRRTGSERRTARPGR